MKKLIIGLFLIALTGPAHATIILFDDYRNDAPGTTGFNEIDFAGTYTAIGSILTAFSVMFGDCGGCWYDRPVGIGSLPDGVGIFHEIVMAHDGSNTQLNYYPKSRTFDTFVGPYGSYCVADFDKGCPYQVPERVPEPITLGLLLIGLPLLVRRTFNKAKGY